MSSMRDSDDVWLAYDLTTGQTKCDVLSTASSSHSSSCTTFNSSGIISSHSHDYDTDGMQSMRAAVKSSTSSTTNAATKSKKSSGSRSSMMAPNRDSRRRSWAANSPYAVPMHMAEILGLTHDGDASPSLATHHEHGGTGSSRSSANYGHVVTSSSHDRRRSSSSSRWSQDTGSSTTATGLPDYLEVESGLGGSPGSGFHGCSGGMNSSLWPLDYRISPRRGEVVGMMDVDGGIMGATAGSSRNQQGRRKSSSSLRRISCDSYDYADELEAARMRIKQAAWEVVDAQQKIEHEKVAALGRTLETCHVHKEKSEKHMRRISWNIKRWFSSSSNKA